MTDGTFETFVTGALLMLAAAVVVIAWLLWSERDARRDGAKAALDGISHELRINLQRMISELSGLANGQPATPSALLPIRHPQLDGVSASLIDTDRRGIAVIAAAYQELESLKLDIRSGLSQGHDVSGAVQTGIDAVIDAVATLYMWDAHGGVSPHDAPSTRSWHVRDWMKARGFPANAFPDMHLRDAVVDRLLVYGMKMTPQPLTMTAHEYYSLQYDRYADPHGPFGRRHKAEVEVEADPVEIVEPEAMPETVHAAPVSPERSPAPAMPSQGIPEQTIRVDEIETTAKPVTGSSVFKSPFSSNS